MDLKVLTVCILSCFRAIQCNTGIGSKLTNNATSNHLETNSHQDLLTRDLCLKSFEETFRSETCRSSKKFEDQVRCLLINETADDVCRLNPKIDLENHIHNNVSSLCEQEFQKNKSGIPVIVRLFLELWNSQDADANCKNICIQSDGQYYNICYFIFKNYYRAQTLPSKLKTNTSAKMESNPKNYEGIDESGVASILTNNGNSKLSDEGNEHRVRDDQNPVPNLSEDNPKTANEQIVKPENEDADASSKLVPKEKFPKPDTFMDERASESGKSRENSEDRASLGSPKGNESEENSHAIFYFMLISAMCITFYFMMYNKKKILALVIEGRRRNVKRRPNSAAYSKLDCNLEEAMASGPSASTSNTLLY